MAMTCKTCRVAMTEQRRSHHKKRKWICPKCGRARMQVETRPRSARVRKPKDRDE